MKIAIDLLFRLTVYCGSNKKYNKSLDELKIGKDNLG